MDAHGDAEQQWREYLQVRQMVKRHIDDARSKGWTALMKKIVEARKLPSQKRMWDLVRTISKHAPMGADPLFVRGDNGDLTTSPAAAVEEWRAHFERVANPSDNPHYDAEHLEMISAAEAADSLVVSDDEALTVTVEDIMEALAKIPAGSAPGPDGVGNIVLKYGGGHRRTPFERPLSPEEAELSRQRQGVLLLLPADDVFRLCVRARCVPTQWKRALQVPISSTLG
jgi:hypothetical protein